MKQISGFHSCGAAHIYLSLCSINYDTLPLIQSVNRNKYDLSISHQRWLLLT